MQENAQVRRSSFPQLQDTTCNESNSNVSFIFIVFYKNDLEVINE